MLVDDQAIVREGMRAMLSLEPDLTVVGEAADGRDALEVARRLRPDVILLDIRMPGMDGLTALKGLKQALPLTSVIMVTLYDDPDYLLEAVTSGAAGYLLKDATRAEIIRAVRVTADGGAIIEPTLLPSLLKRVRNGAGAAAAPDAPQAPEDDLPPITPLSEREMEVLRLVAQGWTNQQIAEELIIGATTVKSHVQNILQKLSVSDRTQAAVRAVRTGLI
jgi:DNA-binding NarL/FixJ family response regulator